MRFEVGRFLIVVFLTFALAGLLAPRDSLANESETSLKRRPLILRIDSTRQTASTTKNLPEITDDQSNKTLKNTNVLANRLSNLEDLRKSIPVEPWAPGRGSLGVKVNVSW